MLGCVVDCELMTLEVGEVLIPLDETVDVVGLNFQLLLVFCLCLLSFTNLVKSNTTTSTLH
jgi:hypothetical protein